MDRKKHPDYQRDESWRYLMPSEDENRVFLEELSRRPSAGGQTAAKSIGLNKYPLERC
jgi:hypothetical protein